MSANKTRNSRGERATRKQTESIPEPKWDTLAARPVRPLRACLFLLLNVDPEHAVRRNWHKRGSDHPVATHFEQLLHTSLNQVFIGNPLLVPLGDGKPTRRRRDFQELMFPLADFITLVCSPSSPFAGQIKSAPEALSRLRVTEAFDRSPPSTRLCDIAKRSLGSPVIQPSLTAPPQADLHDWKPGKKSADEERLDSILGAVLIFFEENSLPEIMRKTKGGLNVAALVNALIDKAKSLNGDATPYGFSESQLHLRLSDALDAARRGDFYRPQKTAK